MEDCSISIADALEMLQSCTKPLICGQWCFNISPERWQPHITCDDFNPVCAALCFFRLKNMYLYFVSYVSIEMAEVAEILPHARQGLTWVALTNNGC